MASGTDEHKFYMWLKQGLKVFACDIQRIETSTGSGVPDLNVCYEGKEVWVELKANNKLLRKEQHAWAMRRAHHYGRVFCLAKIGDKIHVHFYPEVTVKPYGDGAKYVEIVSEPLRILPMERLAVWKSLF